MASLKKRYLAQIERLRASGKQLVSYACPRCDEAIDALRPGVNEIWDTSVTCPHCEQLHYRVMHHDGRVEISLMGGE